ncbi:MAG: hypothetical protein NVS2B3_16410 [Vulcanimicrobiaceae bacterium]
MEALIVCTCRHTIVAHENGRCSGANCDCELASATVLSDAIERSRDRPLASATAQGSRGGTAC